MTPTATLDQEQIITTKTLIPKAFKELFVPSRYKVYYGGRGGAKSQSFAKALLIKGRQNPLRILCARELQVSIADSVHQLLQDQIVAMDMSDFYSVTKTSIEGMNGTRFMFKGLKHNMSEIKSTEGIDIVWVEEAQRVSKESWKYLIPTVRRDGSEIWISYNPELLTDPTHTDFVLNPKPGSIVRKVNFTENPFFPEVLRLEMEHCRNTDLDLYHHVWEGECAVITDAVIFGHRKNRDGVKTPMCRVDVFESKDSERPYFGVDWGFANDPTVMTKSFIRDQRLYIEYAHFGYNVELDDTATLFDKVPGSRKWPIHADNSRPETISFMMRQGFNISAADKWPGSVEDGIAYIRSFDEVVIHERCKEMQLEARTYCYKTDRITNEVLPVIVDKNNHGWDAIRYGHDGHIQRRGAGANLLMAVNS